MVMASALSSSTAVGTDVDVITPATLKTPDHPTIELAPAVGHTGIASGVVIFAVVNKINKK